jgi:hypothetical protein
VFIGTVPIKSRRTGLLLRVPVRDGQTHPHRPRLVVSHSTCPPLSSSPHAHSFVIGPAVIKHTHTHPLIRFQTCCYRRPSCVEILDRPSLSNSLFLSHSPSLRLPPSRALHLSLSLPPSPPPSLPALSLSLSRVCVCARALSLARSLSLFSPYLLSLSLIFERERERNRRRRRRRRGGGAEEE